MSELAKKRVRTSLNLKERAFSAVRSLSDVIMFLRGSIHVSKKKFMKGTHVPLLETGYYTWPISTLFSTSKSSVVDPDTEPYPYPHVFGPPGTGSIS